MKYHCFKCGKIYSFIELAKLKKHGAAHLCCGKMLHKIDNSTAKILKERS